MVKSDKHGNIRGTERKKRCLPFGCAVLQKVFILYRAVGSNSWKKKHREGDCVSDGGTVSGEGVGRKLKGYAAGLH